MLQRLDRGLEARCTVLLTTLLLLLLLLLLLQRRQLLRHWYPSKAKVKSISLIVSAILPATVVAIGTAAGLHLLCQMSHLVLSSGTEPNA